MDKRFAFIFLILLTALVYIGAAGGRAILDDGDALYAHIAQGMAEKGEWVTPYANGVRFLDKPPMMYWLMGISYRIFGFNEFAARFPSALAIVGICIIAFQMAKKAGGRIPAFAAGAASAFSIGAFLFTRMVFPDALFVFFLTLALWAFLEWHVDESNPIAPALIFYAAMAGAVLSKGLMGIFFPCAIIGLYMLWNRNLLGLPRFKIWQGSALFLILTLPWHILAARRNPGFLWYYFVNEQFLRFLGKRQPFDYESIAWPIFWALVLIWMFPWSVFLPGIRHIAKRLNDQERAMRSVIRLSLSWAIVVFLFFSFSSRIEHYSMPIFPPLAVLIGIALSQELKLSDRIELKRRKSINRSFAFLGIFGCILLMLCAAAAIWAVFFPNYFIGSVEIGRVRAYKYYFAPLFDMPSGVLLQLKTPLFGVLAAFGIGMIAAWILNRKGKRMHALVSLSLMMAFFCFFAYRSLGICEEMITSKQFGLKLRELYKPGDDVVIFGDFETANSINFYCSAILKIYNGSAALLQWGLRYPDAPKLIVSAEALEKSWKGESRVFLLAPETGANLPALSPMYALMRSSGRILYSNKREGPDPFP